MTLAGKCARENLTNKSENIKQSHVFCLLPEENVGSAVSSPGGVWGGAPADTVFFAY